MSRDKDPECRGLLLDETPNAYLICSNKLTAVERWWIPRSQVGYCRKTKLAGGDTEIVFTMPEWLIEKKQCWELVP